MDIFIHLAVSGIVMAVLVMEIPKVLYLDAAPLCNIMSIAGTVPLIGLSLLEFVQQAGEAVDGVLYRLWAGHIYTRFPQNIERVV